MTDEATERLWKWIDRPLPDEFFTEKIPEGQHQQRIDEIPVEYRELAQTIYELALWHHKMGRDSTAPGSCCEFRQLLFIAIEKLAEKGVILLLPSYWYMDGVMIEPEWIVRITNGLVKWVCDSSKHECGIWGKCRFSK